MTDEELYKWMDDALNKIEEEMKNEYEKKDSDDDCDKQVGGNHYEKMKISPLEYIQKNNLGFCEGNIIKYVSRWEDKGGIEDLKKAKHYINILIKGYGDNI